MDVHHVDFPICIDMVSGVVRIDISRLCGSEVSFTLEEAHALYATLGAALTLWAAQAERLLVAEYKEFCR